MKLVGFCFIRGIDINSACKFKTHQNVQLQGGTQLIFLSHLMNSVSPQIFHLTEITPEVVEITPPDTPKSKQKRFDTIFKRN